MNIGSCLRLLLTVVLLLAGSDALAQTCAYSATGLSFGVIGASPPPQADTTGTINVTCSGTAGTTVRVCLSIGAGGATGSTVAQRRMANGTNFVNFNLYKDSARTVIWGQRQTVPTYTPFTLDIPIPAGGSASASATMYGRIPSGQPSKTAGTYTSTFGGGTGGEGRITTDLTQSCDSLPNVPRTRFRFSSTVVLGAGCSVAASDIIFGTQGSLASTLDTPGSLQVACSLNTPYTIAMNGGTTTGNIANRMLSLGGAGAGVISYQLYRDSARTLLWGNGTTGTTQAGTGTGATQLVPVYARIPSQTTPAPGTYEDTVTVTLTY